MIFYGKKFRIKRIAAKFFSKFCASSFITFFSVLLTIFLAAFLALYLSYLFLLPKVVTSDNVENIINRYLEKNTKLTLDIDNLKVSPDYKFDINLKADYIRLDYSKDKNFLTLENPVIDINILTLFLGYVDLNRVKTKKIEISTNFTKAQKYSCFDYFDLDVFNHSSKWSLRNIKVIADEFLFNLFDENIKKNFYISAKNLKFSATDLNKPINVEATGIVRSSSYKLADYNLKFEYKIKQNVYEKFKDFVSTLNYNPLAYADKFAFKSVIDIDLKVNPTETKNNITGKVDLKNYSFALKNMRLPSNDLTLVFDGTTIKTDCNFNLIKNQFIKIKSILNYSSNKTIELELKSNEINLSDFKDVAYAVCRIFNIKTSLDEFLLSGILKTDFYIKSDFNTIKSKGEMLLSNAKLTHKKTGLVLDGINSVINFEDNKINIKDTIAYVDKSKFYLRGTIDDKTNLDLSVNSDLINIAQVINMIKSMRFLASVLSISDDYNFKSGLLKIEADIKGTLKKPFIKTNSKLENLNILIKSKNIDFASKEIIFAFVNDKKVIKASDLKTKINNYHLTIPNLEGDILEKDIVIQKTNAYLDGIKAQFSAKIRNYKTTDKETLLSIDAMLPQNNKAVAIKDKNARMLADFSLFKNNLNIIKFDVLDKENPIVTIKGIISNIDSKDFILNDLKINFIENISLFIPKQELSFSAQGEITLNGTIPNPYLDCDLKLYNLICKPMKMSLGELILNVKNSYVNFEAKKGRIFDTDFNLSAQGRLLGEKIVIDFAQFYSPYINLSLFDEFIQKNKASVSNSSLPNLMILSLKGSIAQLDAYNIYLDNINFEGAYRSSALHLNKVTAQLFDGTLDGSVIADFKNNKTKLDLVLRQINARSLASKISGFTIAASGKLSALLNLEFLGFDYDTIQRTLAGYVKFNIDNGELAQFAKLERLLQAGNILSQSILKLTLNSTISAISKQNTGYFKTIEGTINIKDSWANIQYIKIKGPNMSMYLDGRFNIITQIASLKILGRIPVSTVNVLGNIGRFSGNKIVDKMSDDAKGVINTLTASPVEKMMSVEIPQSEINKIPLLENQSSEVQTREFIVKINGLTTNKNSIEYFKWRKRSE